MVTQRHLCLMAFVVMALSSVVKGQNVTDCSLAISACRDTHTNASATAGNNTVAICTALSELVTCLEGVDCDNATQQSLDRILNATREALVTVNCTNSSNTTSPPVNITVPWTSTPWYPSTTPSSADVIMTSKWLLLLWGFAALLCRFWTC